MTQPALILLWLLAALFVAEFVLWVMVRGFRRKFQWLITIADECPTFRPDKVRDFIETRFDPDLGWVPRPSTTGTESVGSLGATSGHDKRVSYSIDAIGARCNQRHSHLPLMLSVYGDSYAFCRQVHDDETWPWYLSQLTQTNVANFGVGGYGIDQAFLRLKREYSKAPSQIVILQFVPETIVRIHSVWRHYFEYGNIFAFKPRFALRDQQLVFIPSPIRQPDLLNGVAELLPGTRANDEFYHSKFRRYAYSPPYLLTFFRHPWRHGILLSQLFAREIARTLGTTYDGAWRTILRDNQRAARHMYQSREATELLIEVIKAFIEFSRQKQFTPVILCLPYEEDIDYYRLHGTTYYEPTLRKISKIVTTLDATRELSSHSGESLYTNRFFGSHLTATGNKIVAEFVASGLADFSVRPHS